MARTTDDRAPYQSYADQHRPLGLEFAQAVTADQITSALTRRGPTGPEPASHPNAGIDQLQAQDPAASNVADMRRLSELQEARRRAAQQLKR